MATSVRLSVKTKWKKKRQDFPYLKKQYMTSWMTKKTKTREQRPTETKARYENLSSTEGRAQER